MDNITHEHQILIFFYSPWWTYRIKDVWRASRVSFLPACSSDAGDGWSNAKKLSAKNNILFVLPHSECFCWVFVIEVLLAEPIFFFLLRFKVFCSAGDARLSFEGRVYRCLRPAFPCFRSEGGTCDSSRDVPRREEKGWSMKRADVIKIFLFWF